MHTFLLVEPVPENVDPDLDPDPRHRSIKGNNFEGEKNHNCLILGLARSWDSTPEALACSRYQTGITLRTSSPAWPKRITPRRVRNFFIILLIWIIEVECRCPCWRVHVRTRICLVGPGCPFMLKMFPICGCGQDAEMNLAYIFISGFLLYSLAFMCICLR
jgi:hypothetical protein